MKQPLFPAKIIVVFLLSLVYWIYLACTTRMVICWDSLGYQELGTLLQNHGFLAYFKNGPNREPLYPLLITASMTIEHISEITYTKIMALFGIILLFLTQALTYKILRLLNIRNGICILVLSYLALSPAINNSAFSLYSEIVTYPFVLGISLTSFYIWEAIKYNKEPQAYFYSLLLGTLLTLTTLVKGVFECIAPVYLIILFATIFLTCKQEITKRILPFILTVLVAANFFYAPITSYKWLNWHYNGNFTLTTRGSWMIYGNTVRRMEPLNLKRFAEALAYTPGEGVCNSLFSPKECAFWYFEKSDLIGIRELKKLKKQHLSPPQINDTLLGLSLQKASQNPFQYALLDAIEGLKMFFWESTQIGFVNYPQWLQKIYDIKFFNNTLRFIVSLLTFVSVLYLWWGILKKRSSPLGFLIGLLIIIYIFFFSFVSILTRYALPLAPLYLITIGIWMDQKLAPKKIN